MKEFASTMLSEYPLWIPVFLLLTYEVLLGLLTFGEKCVRIFKWMDKQSKSE